MIRYGVQLHTVFCNHLNGSRKQHVADTSWTSEYLYAADHACTQRLIGILDFGADNENPRTLFRGRLRADLRNAANELS